MSLSSSLQVGVSGLTASQNALNTTAHNLANVGTKGYTRQQVVMADYAYQKWGVNHISTLQTGLGVNIEAVRQVRSIFYDKSYRTEVGRQAFYEAQYESVQEVESMFGELEGVAFQDSLKNFWTSIQELSKQPDAIEVRATLVQNAESLLERANTIYKQLNEYQLNLNKQISDKVSRINEIATGISDLNRRISLYESNGVENANDLRDERNNLLDELGGLINISYKENANGVVTVSAEDMPLVTETGTNKMGVAKVSESSDFLKPVWVAFNADVFNLDRPSTTENQSDIGSLRGLLVARGSEKANYTDIPVKPVEADYTDQNKYKADLAAYEVKAAEYNKNVNVSVIMTTQAQFDQLIHGMVTAINDILAPNKEIEQAVIGGMVTVDADGNQIVTVGGDVIKDAIVKPDGTIVKKIKVLDEEKAPYGMDLPDHTQGEALFNRKSTERYSEESIQVYDASGTLQTVTVKKYNEEDPSDIYSLFTLGEIEINPNIKNNYSKIPLSTSKEGDEVDMKTAQALTDLWSKPFASLSPNSLAVNTFKDYYTNFTGELATKGDELNTISQNQAIMAQNIDDQRQAIMGVSSDEELTNLIKFQHAYNASSRYITVIDQMLEHLLTRL